MEIKEIQKQVESVIKHSQHLEHIDCTALIQDWFEAKRDFMEAFGGEPIFEYPETVYFELGPKEKRLRVSDFIEMVDTRWCNGPLAQFLSEQQEGFFENRVVKAYTVPWNGVQIVPGMKLLKAFKFFEEDKEVLNAMQSAASMIIQEDKIEGKLCLSVHPLDFLSSSENNHNWRSCHALDGEYRSGNLSYMVDRATIMCYLKSTKEEILPNFPSSVPWNSKKWRVLLFLSEKWDMMFAGRQYPFNTETGLNMITEKLLPQTHIAGKWGDWDDTKIRDIEGKSWFHTMHSPYVPIGQHLMPMRELIHTVPGSLFFNDLLHSSCYDPVYSYRMAGEYGWVHPTVGQNTKFILGGKVKCLCCGEHDVTMTETFLCPDCELEYGECENDDFATCPCCGHRFFYEDGTYVDSADETVCPNCADSDTMCCPSCGDVIYSDESVYDRDSEEYVCKDCYESHMLAKEDRLADVYRGI